MKNTGRHVSTGCERVLANSARRSDEMADVFQKGKSSADTTSRADVRRFLLHIPRSFLRDGMPWRRLQDIVGKVALGPSGLRGRTDLDRWCSASVTVCNERPSP
ncbi:hypothetical protein MRX96_010073 [Rhipicephalus microplus]